jgi:hypothetical protein
MLSEAGKRWIRRAAMTEPNSHMAAELWYMLLGNGEPYPWKRIKEHWNVFKEA